MPAFSLNLKVHIQTSIICSMQSMHIILTVFVALTLQPHFGHCSFLVLLGRFPPPVVSAPVWAVPLAPVRMMGGKLPRPILISFQPFESAYSKRQRLGAGDGQQDFFTMTRGMVSGFNRFDLWMWFYPVNFPTDGRSRKSRTNTEITVGLYDFCFKPHKIHISCTDINKIHMNFCDFQRKSIWNHANCGVFIDKIARFQWDLSQSRKNQWFFEEIWRKLLTIYIYI